MPSPHEARAAVVVTGASGGIGREIAKVAAHDGGPVVLVARSADALAEAAEEVRRAGGEPFRGCSLWTRPHGCPLGTPPAGEGRRSGWAMWIRSPRVGDR